MKNLLLLSCVLTVAGLSCSVATAQESKAKLLLGKWEVTKSGPESLPEGTIVEFSKDGKVKLTRELMGKSMSAEATYTIDGDKFTIVDKMDKKVRKQTIKIIKISDEALTTENEKGTTVELKRKK